MYVVLSIIITAEFKVEVDSTNVGLTCTTLSVLLLWETGGMPLKICTPKICTPEIESGGTFAKTVKLMVGGWPPHPLTLDQSLPVFAMLSRP